MSKAVLVMDMPESCSKCKFSYEFQGVKKCNLLNALCNGGEAIIPKDKYTECQHDACPLAELPERMDALKASATVNGCLHPVDYAQGWNACLDKILGR